MPLLRALLLPAFLLGAPALGGEPLTTATAASDGTVKTGEKMPRFGGWGLDGQMVSLSRILRSEEKTPIVVSVFASTCEPCERGLPTLHKVAGEAGARTVLIAQGEDASRAGPFLKRLNVDATCLLDEYMKVSERLGVTKIPRTYVLAPDGTVRTIFVVEGEDFDAALKRALSAAAPPAKPVPPTARR